MHGSLLRLKELNESMTRAFTAILVIAAVGCGDEVDQGIADPGGLCGFGVQDCYCDTDTDCDTPETCVEAYPGSSTTICRYARESGAGFGGVGGFGGEGGAGGMAATTEEFRVMVPNFLEYFGGLDFPTWPALISGGGLAHLVAPWHVVRREPPSADEVYPDRVEGCTRIDYVDREVSHVVGACVETGFEIVAAGGDGGISVVVGTPPGLEFWQYTELRFYYEPDDRFPCWNDPNCDDFSNLDLCPPICETCGGVFDACHTACSDLHLTGTLHASEFTCEDLS